VSCQATADLQKPARSVGAGRLRAAGGGQALTLSIAVQVGDALAGDGVLVVVDLPGFDGESLVVE